MKQGPKDEFTSPLDEVLQGLPDEEPPADLQGRCLAALGTGAEHARVTRAPRSLRALIATAAVLTAAGFVFVTGLVTIVQPRRDQASLSRVTQLAAPADATIPEGGELLGHPPEAGDAAATAVPSPMGSAGGPYRAVQMQVETRRAGGAGAPTGVGVQGAGLGGGAAGERRASTNFVDGGASGGSAEDAALSEEVRVAVQRPGDARVRIESFPKQGIPALEAEVNGDVSDSLALAKPWRDESGERQKITRKEMEVEVKDVEEAHERATSLIEGGGGYVQTEELRIDQGERDEAHLVARVPIANLSDVVSQLRKLGKVRKLIGESDDRTKEYASRGASIRELGAKECELVEKYEKEKNRYRKQQLYQQIMAIREQNRQAKQPLLELSDKTHLASLDLTLVEAGGPGRFLAEVCSNAGTAALWLAVSAIFWVPALLVITLVWNQVGKRKA